ncbi:MAG: hypothetical protein AB8B74_12075 [Crocinitomicaceae bacterium]
MPFTKNNHIERKINLLPVIQYKNIIVIINKAEQIRHNQLHLLFSNASFSFLTLRSEKTDDSNGLNFTLHKSDFRFGTLKNDRLKILIKQEFDLLIDLSNNKNLSYFSRVINAGLKTGCFNRANNQNFDLLVKHQDSIEKIINDIANQINILTTNKEQ